MLKEIESIMEFKWLWLFYRRTCFHIYAAFVKYIEITKKITGPIFIIFCQNWNEIFVKDDIRHYL